MSLKGSCRQKSGKQFYYLVHFMGKTPYNDGKPLRAIVTTYIQEIVYNT
jgi:hypothetical protein